VTLKFTAKNAFGVPETHTKDIKVNWYQLSPLARFKPSQWLFLKPKGKKNDQYDYD
jgi:hypothetical protein